METESINENAQDDGYNQYARPPRKQKQTTNAWDHVTEKFDEQGVRISATCHYCEEVLSAIPGSGTSHLNRHVARCLEKLETKNDNDDDDYVFDMNDLRKEIMLYVVKGNHPFSIVEERRFNSMMKMANPKFKYFSRTSLRRDVLSEYVSEKEALRSALGKVSGRICLTTDNWKLKHTRQYYICVTGHFVDDDWKLHKRILMFKGLSPPFDGVSIAQEIMIFLSQWGIENKILTITTDNATYNDSMIVTVKRRLLSKGILSCAWRFFHVRCCAHIINLIVESGLTRMKRVIDKICSLVKLVIISPARMKEFYDKVKVARLNVKRKLSLDTDIRWNSTYKMLDAILYFKDAFVCLDHLDSFFQGYVPSHMEWEEVTILHSFVKTFYQVTCMFSAVKYPTSNIYFKGAWMAHRRMLEIVNGPDTFLKGVVSPMVAKFDKYWSDYNLYLCCTAILDPRFKVKFIEYCLNKLFPSDEATKCVDNVLDTLTSLYDAYKLESATSPVSMPNPPPRITGEYFDDYHLFSGRSERSQLRKSQFELYLAEPAYDLDSEIDVLEFWQQASTRYPVLSRLARDLRTVPVSSVTSESAFSLGGKTISSSHSSLNPEVVQALICFQDWQRDENDISLENNLTSDEEFTSENEEDENDPLFSSDEF